jgi:hypothetical protein
VKHTVGYNDLRLENESTAIPTKAGQVGGVPNSSLYPTEAKRPVGFAIEAANRGARLQLRYGLVLRGHICRSEYYSHRLGGVQI